MTKQEIFVFPDEEEASKKLNRKAKESPFMIIGLTGLIGALGYSAYRFKNRGSMSTSVYLMQTRVAAQGAVVSCLALGVAYTMFNNYVLHKDEDNK
ncbi:HIG1 domain family member 1B-like [Chironomus tepperi]|uniref:HIG1 domain family member 1B-like n=1 Tax=Chironomus tepperi TaxID=113505 RepID=UPI00391F9B52